MICVHLRTDLAAWLVFWWSGRPYLTCSVCGRALAVVGVAA